MRRVFACLLIIAGAAATAAAQTEIISQAGAESGRKFLPRDWIRGYVDVALAPPHNEPDLNRCAAWAGTHTGVAGLPCSAFARYVASGYLELRPIGGTTLRRVFLFWEPNLFLGRNVPQISYNFSAIPMSYERALGVGVELPRGFELRMTQHRVEWLGRYKQYLGIADLGKNGPLGLYTTVSARWYFGNWTRQR
jgi:hypothetical protein